MAERAEWRHGLESRLERLTSGASGNAKLNVEIMASCGHINLRGDPNDTAFANAVQVVLQQPLPLEPNTVGGGSHRLYWLGPDEWLLSSPRDGIPALLAKLEDALQGIHAAANDLSGGLVQLRLRGSCVRDILAAGCPLDLGAASIPGGRCAQTGLAKAGALLCPVEDGAFDVLVRRSFADYLLSWLAAIAGGRGLSATTA